MNNFRKLANNEGYLVDLQGVKIYFPQESLEQIEKSDQLNPKSTTGSTFKKGITIEKVLESMVESSSSKEIKGNTIQFNTDNHIGYDAFVDNMNEPDGFVIRNERNGKFLALAQKNDRFAVEGSFHSNATNSLHGVILDASSVNMDKNSIPADFEAREIHSKGMLNYGISLNPGRAFKLDGELIPRVSQMNNEGFLSQDNDQFIPAKLGSLEEYKKVRDSINSHSLTSNYSNNDLRQLVSQESQKIKKEFEIAELRQKSSVFNPAIHVKKKNQDGEEVIGFKVIPSDFSMKLEKALDNSSKPSNENKVQHKNSHTIGKL